MRLRYEHRHFAHCESGVMAGMLSHHGLPISEPMAFGLGGALTFAYLPFLKMGNMPLVTYRMYPGVLVRSIPKRLGLGYFLRRFSDPDEAFRQLDETLARGQVVAIQTSAYFTTYFPPEMRFQFNAHNVVVVGKEGSEYLVSDPVFDHEVRIEAADLRKARFARGFGAPRGLMHYPTSVPRDIRLEPLVLGAVRKTVRTMLHTPLPGIGIRGMRALARRIERLGRIADPVYARHFLGNVVRMQEEIGTGGGGFRYIYAAFLQEAGRRFDRPRLVAASERMTDVGDRWRQFAANCARSIKRRDGELDYRATAGELLQCAEEERKVYQLLRDAY